MIRRPPRSTQSRSSAASDVYKRQPYTWWSFPLCFIFLDFCRYWAHRVAHEQRIWWATRVPHHSSEQYNFSVSFRLSWVQGFKVLFFLPVAMAGFHPVVFFI